MARNAQMVTTSGASRSAPPPEMNQTFKNLENNGNPWGIGFSTRGDWASALEAPLLEEGAAIRCNNLPTLAFKIDALLAAQGKEASYLRLRAIPFTAEVDAWIAGRDAALSPARDGGVEQRVAARFDDRVPGSV